MATTTTLSVDRATRDVLHREISDELGAVGGLGNLDDGAGISAAQDEREKVDACFALLDALGWAEHDERRAFELPITTQTVAWLRRVLQTQAPADRDEQTRDIVGRLVDRLDSLSEPASCDGCSALAVYRWEYRPGCREHLCEECARYRGAMDRGEAALALDVLGFAVGTARNAGVADAQLREAFDMYLMGRNASVNAYPCGIDGVLGRGFREDEPWRWRGTWERLPEAADTGEAVA